MRFSRVRAQFVFIHFGLNHRGQRTDDIVFASWCLKRVRYRHRACIQINRISSDHGNKPGRTHFCRGHTQRHTAVAVGTTLGLSGIAHTVVIGIHTHQGIADQTIHDGCRYGARASTTGRQSSNGGRNQTQLEMGGVVVHGETPLDSQTDKAKVAVLLKTRRPGGGLEEMGAAGRGSPAAELRITCPSCATAR